MDIVEITESGGGDYGIEPHAPCPVTSAACAALLDGRMNTAPQSDKKIESPE